MIAILSNVMMMFVYITNNDICEPMNQSFNIDQYEKTN